MITLLLVYLATAAFIALTVGSPLLARYVLWINKMSDSRKDLDFDEVCLRFRMMNGLGAILGVVLSVLATVSAVQQ